MLKPFLRNGISPVEVVPETVKVVDGGALLWCCDWKKNETFNVIFERYACFLRKLNLHTIVFDGYDLSTKDSTHQKRAGNISQDVDIKEDNLCPASRKDFLGNFQNKKHFVEHLASHLKSSFKVIECPSDADTSIVKEALTMAKNSMVTVLSDDTDVLSFLVHHVSKDPSLKEIFLGDMTRKKGQQRQYYRITDTTAKYRRFCQYLLFAHAFTGCDTTSAIHNFGKTAIYQKIEASPALQSIIGQFYEETSPEEIGNATIRFF